MKQTHTEMGECEQNYDAIVIGSGIGGLTTAAILSRLHKMRVLVLERHFEMGGLTHVFSRGRYKWEVGVHYVGRMVPGLLQRILFDYITNKRLDWMPMPSPFERFIYPSCSFGVPSDWQAYQHSLIEAFPASKKQIKKYFRDIIGCARWFSRFYLSGFLPKPIAAVLRGINYVTRKKTMLTTRAYMDRYISDKKLANLLCSQWGDYAVPPDESCFCFHATVVKHYGFGGFLPEGGTSRIAASVERVIESSGGTILTNREVERIILKNGRAVGVRVRDLRNPEAVVETEYYAKYIISNVGVKQTYGNLVNSTATANLFDQAQQMDQGYSAISVYLGLRESPTKVGVQGENYWINELDEILPVTAQTKNLLALKPNTCYVSFPSLRNKTAKTHTATIIAIVTQETFSQWSESQWRGRDESYYRVKDQLAQSLLNLVEKHIPGIKALVAYVEVSTPLSMAHFTKRDTGYMYGFRNTPKYFEKKRFNPQSPVPGLFISGTDVCSLGVVGAMMGGVAAAAAISGPLGLFKIVGRARAAARRPSDPKLGLDPEIQHRGFTPSSDKVVAELKSKTKLTKSIYEFVYCLPRAISFCPGQYARIQYNELDYGSYSIAGMRNREIKFIIDTRFGGSYQRYFTNLAPGDRSTIRLPIGDFVLRLNPHKKVFISTGTGIAPQLAMIDRLVAQRFSGAVDVYFGAKNHEDLFISRYLQPHEDAVRLNLLVCLSRETDKQYYHGRVTDLLRRRNNDAPDCDFYVSGNPYMVSDVVEILRSSGAERIYTENY